MCCVLMNYTGSLQCYRVDQAFEAYYWFFAVYVCSHEIQGDIYGWSAVLKHDVKFKKFVYNLKTCFTPGLAQSVQWLGCEVDDQRISLASAPQCPDSNLAGTEDGNWTILQNVVCILRARMVDKVQTNYLKWYRSVLISECIPGECSSVRSSHVPCIQYVQAVFPGLISMGWQNLPWCHISIGANFLCGLIQSCSLCWFPFVDIWKACRLIIHHLYLKVPTGKPAEA